ncbi:MAG: RNA 2',3'-cyclic phosphodiesterase [bacterium]|nr:RNA 2',3'-cyclic phosphodiesterase [bacterium]
MRVFIAVELPEEIKEELYKLVSFLKQSISDVKWVEKENFHITIRFIGEVEEDGILKLEKILDDIRDKFPPFRVEIKGIGNFPHVLWVGIGEGSDTLKNIAYAIEGSLLREGFQPADKLFSPHITLGRIKKNIKKIPKDKEFGPYSFIVDSITLMQSQLFSIGPVYTPIKVVRFI